MPEEHVGHPVVGGGGQDREGDRGHHEHRGRCPRLRGEGGDLAVEGDAVAEGVGHPVEHRRHGSPGFGRQQEGRGDDAMLVVVSHTASDADLAATVETLRGMPNVRDVSSVMRVEGVDA